MITNYADLKVAIVRFVANQKVTEVVDTIIQLADARIRNDVVLRRIERAVHAQFDGAVIFLPDDCEAVQRLMYYIGEEEYSVPYSDPKSVERFTGSVGQPIAYTMLDQSIAIYPTPDAAYDYSLYYVPAVRPLSDEEPTNWLLERSPNVYLQAACLEAYQFLHDSEQAGKEEGRYRQSIDALAQSSERQRMPSLTAMRSRPFRTVRSRVT